MANTQLNANTADSGAPFWGIVDDKGNVRSNDKGFLLIFKTRARARRAKRSYNGSVRKVYVNYEVRKGGGA